MNFLGFSPWVRSAKTASTRSNLTFDISRCGEGWCGVEVRNKECAQTALRIAAKEAHEGTAVFFLGRLAFADKATPYTVSATLHVKDGAVQLRLMGQPGDKLDPWRRTFPFNELMARSGPSQCKPAAKLS